MNAYWVSFRIMDNDTYLARYAALVKALEGLVATTVWSDLTSFWIFDSTSTAAQITATCKAAIDPKVDQVVVGSPYIKTMTAVGKIDGLNQLQLLVDFAKTG